MFIKRLQYYFPTTAIIVMILFFVDEGFYNFNWMEKTGNWVAFALYFITILLAEYIVFMLIVRSKLSKWTGILVTILGGSILGVALLVVLFRVGLDFGQ